MSNADRPTRRPGWPVGVGLVLILLTVLALVLLAALKFRQPPGQPLPVYGQIGDFTLTNQNGKAVSLAELRGRVWVADIIFTRCTGPCPQMTRQMKTLQDALAPDSEVKLVTLTTDPDFDTPSVLARYGERFGANPARWMFLTGTKPEIGKLAIDSLKLTAIPKQPEERESPADLFVHSTIFVIVDKQARLRGVFETSGEGIDPREALTRVLTGVKRLEREP